MRIVVSGGTGLIGRALVRRLVADGDRVVVLSRRPPAAGIGPGVEVVGWDGGSGHGLSETLVGCDAVVHLAGESIAASRWTPAQKRRIRQSRVGPTRALAELVSGMERPPGVFLQASAVGYYGDTGDEVVEEASPPSGDFLGRVCQEWEAASVGVEAAGIRRVILRTGLVLSTEGGALPRLVLPFRLFAGGPVGSGHQWMPWIHLADEIEAVCFLLHRPAAAGAFNLAAPNPETNESFSRLLGKILGRPASLRAPAFALRLALGEMAEIILAGQRAVPRRLLDLGFEFRFSDAESALRDLLAATASPSG